MRVKINKTTKKFRWKNIWLMVVFLSSLGLVLHDLYMIIIYPFICNRIIGFTVFGIITFMVALYFVYDLGEYFYEKIK